MLVSFRPQNTMSMLVIVAVAALGCAAPGPSRPLVTSDDDMSISDAPLDGGIPADIAGPIDATPQSCGIDLAASVTCGKCGTATQTCVAGQVVIGACTAETGICAPGDTIYTTNGCEIRVCGKDCKWPGWSLKPGAECSHDANCVAGPDCDHAGTRKCVACKLGPCQCLPIH